MNFEERLARYLGKKPVVASSAFIAPGAVVVGDVTLGENVSIWYQAVVRGDINRIEIGEGSNIQDCAIVHLADELPAIIGSHVTCGHRALIHACEIGDETLVGMGATVLDGARVGRQCMIGAHSLVTKGTVIPDGSLVIGTPGRVIRPLTDQEKRDNLELALKYIEVGRAHRRLAQASGETGRSEWEPASLL